MMNASSELLERERQRGPAYVFELVAVVAGLFGDRTLSAFALNAREVYSAELQNALTEELSRHGAREAAPFDASARESAALLLSAASEWVQLDADGVNVREELQGLIVWALLENIDAKRSHDKKASARCS